MQKLAPCLALLAPVMFLGACSVTNGLGEEAGNARLPTGVELLDSDEEECSGVVHIDEAASSSSRRSGRVVQQGQNATFRVDERMEWTCVDDSSVDSETIDCPDDTSHVRITRAATGDELLLECYG